MWTHGPSSRKQQQSKYKIINLKHTSLILSVTPLNTLSEIITNLWKSLKCILIDTVVVFQGQRVVLSLITLYSEDDDSHISHSMKQKVIERILTGRRPNQQMLSRDEISVLWVRWQIYILAAKSPENTSAVSMKGQMQNKTVLCACEVCATKVPRSDWRKHKSVFLLSSSCNMS